MCSRFGRVEMWCDAPPYDVVRACTGCGFQSPLDVRWCRMPHFLEEAGQGKETFGMRLWRWLFGWASPQQTCSCGQPLPVLATYEFSRPSEQRGDYLLAQCPRCWTMFWDAPTPVSAWVREGWRRDQPADN